MNFLKFVFGIILDWVWWMRTLKLKKVVSVMSLMIGLDFLERFLLVAYEILLFHL